MKQRLIIIGNGMASGRLLQLLQKAAPERFAISVFGEEAGGSYNRVLLSPLLGKELSLSDIMTLTPSWYDAAGIALYQQERIVAIDTQARHVVSDQGRTLEYDQLVIATGSHPLALNVPGEQLGNLYRFRTLADVDDLQQHAQHQGKAVVVGGGFLGLEAAEGLRRLGMDVTLVHRSRYLLNRQLDAQSAQLLQETLEARGIRFALEAQVSEFVGDECVTSVQLDNGLSLAAELVVTAIGIRPNCEVAASTELTVKRGIVVDQQLRTSDANIYALGECCQFGDHTYGLVAPIWQQAQVLSQVLLGQPAAYQEQPVATQLKISGVELFSCGDIAPPHAEFLVYHDQTHREYRKLWLRDGRLIGAVLYGDVRHGQWYFEQLNARTDLNPCKQHLLFGEALCRASLQPEDKREAAMNEQQKHRIVVVGNGMVGQHFVEQLVATASDPTEVHVLCEEPCAAYDRVHLSEYFSGASYDDLCLVEPGFYDQPGLHLHLGQAAQRIDRENKAVVTASETFPYDTLVLATGSYPFVPPIPGNDGEACFVYRTLEDLDNIRASASDAQVGVVVGGGLLGLEAANALKSLGLKAHVVEFAPQLMPVQLDRDGGQLLKQKITELGVDVHCDKATAEIIAGEQHRYRMNFADGSYLETDLILFSAGIRPQDTLARESDLRVGERGGITVNDQCQTSDPSIYAVGECALWNNQIFGLVAPGYTMAKTAAAAIAGQPAAFTGADMSTKLKLLGVDVGSIGDAHGRTPGSISYRYWDEDAVVYARIVVSEDRTKLLGAVLVGDNSRYDTLLQYALNGLALPEQPQSLILPSVEGSEPVLGADALPDNATICSCLNVTKGQICGAVSEGALNVADVKAATKAATGCGGCAAMLKNVVDAELTKQGIEVSNDLCEHFAHTREDLYNIVRVEGIRSFQDLISRHGQGLGCDICKPVAASILASCWNDHIQETPLVSLQDTNDTFMANMQKNGTYSVVPRIAGGEITPDKLILLGEVAKKYNLYTKITGGQRVDLFGAQLHELPLIWEALIEAGFETGHAYGKSLRTVKSCVGSTWCRYGVNDSAAMAIYLENRYKGLRAPHKIKMAVSGCTRECAEAQSKDIGVIATEHGWNLYVCGNGGMKPRHADLFATDLDDQTLIAYIDRLLMFYIKTADRLQRTSVWMDNLEGGLTYLQGVVIDDRLGLASELEAQMAHVVGTYQCEWRSTLADQEKLKRFRTFVNSDDQQDPQIVHIMERDQIRPAP
ncbi:nitrite reductase large subunit NirB [Neptunomonas sp. XY-337]|uniref:nitrite reductase large subunit NirB n=1 Tax=Neptunomonas sp. XY-337 TaxID=2561897 RepID=UPI00145C0187